MRPGDMLVGPSVAADAIVEGYQIKVFRLPEVLREGEHQWQADHGNAHASGRTPGEAVDRLIQFIKRTTTTR